MSGQINIRRDVQDAFYRYKMPRLQCKIEGKGNGIKTVVPNMVDIGKALARPASYITKFFGAELGALSTCDEKAAKYIINGAHEAEKLQTLLDTFISKFVLCPQCDNPETVLSVSKKDGTIYRTCQACGNKATVDMLHKLVSYIRANPPPKPVKKSQAKDRADEAGETISNMRASPLAKDAMAGGDDAIEGMLAPEDFDDSFANFQVTEADDGDWDEATATAQRKDELSELSESVRQKLALGEKAVDPLDSFGDYLQENSTASNDEIMGELRKRGIKNDKAIVVIIQVLFTDDFLKAFKNRQELLESLVTNAKEQKALLGSVERLVAVVSPSMLSKISPILQTLYNADLVEEEVLAEWRVKSSKKFVSNEIGVEVRKRAEPFFNWLDNADESGSEEEEDDEE